MLSGKLVDDQDRRNFPERAAAMRSYREVTLEQLLSHRGGAPVADADGLWGRIGSTRHADRATSVSVGRRRDQAPVHPARNTSANGGYAIAGAMPNGLPPSRGGLVRERLFAARPEFGRFRRAGITGKVDQPGHTLRAVGLKPVPPGGANNPWRRSCRTVHCSIGDLASAPRFISRARVARATSESGSFETPHADRWPGCALGWLVVERGWAGG